MVNVFNAALGTGTAGKEGVHFPLVSVSVNQGRGRSVGGAVNRFGERQGTEVGGIL